MNDSTLMACGHAVAQEYRLPNGMTVRHLNQCETDFTYKEVFEDQIYLKHGIRLSGEACVFDVGANIGMFALFAKQVCPNSRIYAFEPAPDVYRLLHQNVARYGSSIDAYQCGLSDTEGVMTFTYYPNYSILSGFYADEDEDKRSFSDGVRNQVRTSIASDRVANRIVERLVSEKLSNAQKWECQLRTVSSIIRETQVDRIDLLKIDAEKSELSVLRGIAENHWPKIDQVVMEAHRIDQSELIIRLLNTKGFRVHTEQEAQFSESSITNIFATRP